MGLAVRVLRGQLGRGRGIQLGRSVFIRLVLCLLLPPPLLLLPVLLVLLVRFLLVLLLLLLLLLVAVVVRVVAVALFQGEGRGGWRERPLGSIVGPELDDQFGDEDGRVPLIIRFVSMVLLMLVLFTHHSALQGEYKI